MLHDTNIDINIIRQNSDEDPLITGSPKIMSESVAIRKFLLKCKAKICLVFTEQLADCLCIFFKQLTTETTGKVTMAPDQNKGFKAIIRTFHHKEKPRRNHHYICLDSILQNNTLHLRVKPNASWGTIF